MRLHLVGHADNQPLSTRWTRVYGDNEGLSRERAGEVAEFFKLALTLPPEAIAFEWAGDTQPVASNATTARPRAEPSRRSRGLVRRAQGRAMEEVVVKEDFSASRSAASRRSARCVSATGTHGARG